MNSMKMFSYCISFGLLLIISCSSFKPGASGEKQNPKLDGKWRLIQLLDMKNIDSLYVEQLPFMMISLEENKVTGNSGCNNFFGKLEVSNSEINFGELGSTKMFCSEVPEAEFFEALDKTSHYRIKGKTLELLSGRNVLLIFERTEE